MRTRRGWKDDSNPRKSDSPTVIKTDRQPAADNSSPRYTQTTFSSFTLVESVIIYGWEELESAEIKGSQNKKGTTPWCLIRAVSADRPSIWDSQMCLHQRKQDAAESRTGLQLEGSAWERGKVCQKLKSWTSCWRSTGSCVFSWSRGVRAINTDSVRRRHQEREGSNRDFSAVKSEFWRQDKQNSQKQRVHSEILPTALTETRHC